MTSTGINYTNGFVLFADVNGDGIGDWFWSEDWVGDDCGALFGAE